MQIRNFRSETSEDGQRQLASVAWEENRFPTDDLYFSLDEGGGGPVEIEANAFLAGLFPLALLHGERRIRVEAPVCPMLCEGLRTIHAWWVAWGLTQAAAPVIEAPTARLSVDGRTEALAFLSGGVDSIHMLVENRRRLARGDSGHVRRGIFLHGFDIGKKRKRGPERGYFELARRHLQPLADALDVELVSASTNLRHFPTVEGFWNKQLHGACLAAMAHAVSRGPTLALVAATFDIANMSAWGSHPVIDPSYSTQRVRMVHECARHSRLDKVRALADWPLALDNIRVCQIRQENRLNCGECEKCLRTRLELFVLGVGHAGAFGETRPSLALVDAKVEVHDRYTASCYRDLVGPLRAVGEPALAECLALKLEQFAREGFWRDGAAAAA
jgi:hypothetical protein